MRRAATPLISYYAVTIAVPLANGAAATSDTFLEHTLVVLLVPLVVVASACILRDFWRAVRLR